MNKILKEKLDEYQVFLGKTTLIINEKQIGDNTLKQLTNEYNNWISQLEKNHEDFDEKFKQNEINHIIEVCEEYLADIQKTYVRKAPANKAEISGYEIFINELKNKYNSTSNSEKQKDKINGFFYKGKQECLKDFHNSLLKNKYIEITNFREFSKYFGESFTPNDQRIHWKKNINDLYYLIQKIRENHEFFKFKRNNYREIIKYMFTYTGSDGKTKILTKEILSQNNSKQNNNKKIDHALSLITLKP